MRSLLGTRIELCVLFVQIIFGSGERNQWQTARQLRLKEDIGDEFEALKGEVGHLRASLACRTSTCSSAGDGVDSTSLGYAPNGYGFKAVGDTSRPTGTAGWARARGPYRGGEKGPQGSGTKT
eukprot:6138896-Prymnesium_polylepis.4